MSAAAFGSLSLSVIIVLLGTFSVKVSESQSNECNNYEDLPSMHGRNPDVPFSPSSEAICDNSLTEGWYRAGPYDMATEVPRENTCGTAYPFYMDIPVPTDPGDSTVYNARACMSDGVDNCYYYVNIQVKNCGEYRVYKLKSSGFCQSAYCFHVANSSIVPSFQVSNAAVQFHKVQWENEGSDRVPKLIFKCDFEPDTVDDFLYYAIAWSVNQTQIGDDKVVNASSLSDGYLHEKELTDRGYRHGITIFCSVGSQFTNDSATGPRTKSSGFFAGLMIKTPSIQIEERQSGTFTVQPTVPFACENQNPDCELAIHAEDPNMGECEGNTFITESKRCQVKVTGKTESDQGTFYINEEYKQDYSIEINHAQSDDSYDKTSHYDIALRTDVVKHLFWSNTSLPSVPVNVFYTNSVWRYKYCYQRGDPNYKTFDGLYFSYHTESSYLMYENTRSNQSVQIRTKTCSDQYNFYQCGCGVAVNAGRDVFIVYTCDGSTILNFPVCDDNVLDVRSDGDKKWKVTFPSGTIVKIEMICWPSCDELNVDVYIYPSASDESSTRGLCGTLDGNTANDFQLPDGSITSSTNAFASSWKLSQDLFVDTSDVDKYDSLVPWSHDVLLCVCPRATKNGRDVAPPLRLPVAELHCSYKQYIGKCNTNRYKQFQCFVKSAGAKRRKKREIQLHSFKIQERSHKRSSGIVMLEADAKVLCKTTFNASQSYTDCTTKVNGIGPSFMESCVSDVMYTGKSYAATRAIESLQDSCVSIVTKDVDLQRNEPSVTNTVYKTSCPNNCSGQGLCENGFCECNGGFVGTDCSLDENTPPIVTGITDNGFCDLSEESCDRISLYGRNFLYTNNTKCRIASRQILTDGTSIDDGETTEIGDQRSPFEGMCNLGQTRRKRSTVQSNIFAYAYNISISNNGNAFSNDSKLFVYDSTCQEMVNISGMITFYLKNGNCFIDGQCVAEYAVSPIDSCRQCLTSNDSYSWTELKDCGLSTTTISSSSKITSTMSISTQKSTISTNSAAGNPSVASMTSVSVSTQESTISSSSPTGNPSVVSFPSTQMSNAGTPSTSSTPDKGESSALPWHAILAGILGAIAILISILVGLKLWKKFSSRSTMNPRVGGSQVSMRYPNVPPTDHNVKFIYGNMPEHSMDIFQVSEDQKYTTNMSRPNSSQSLRSQHHPDLSILLKDGQKYH